MEKVEVVEFMVKRVKENIAKIEDANKEKLKLKELEGQDYWNKRWKIEHGLPKVEQVKSDLRLIRKLLLEINLGATAIGTGINAPSDYSRIVCNHLSNLIGLNVVTSDNLIEATWDTGSYVQISGVLKRFAVKLSKICNDLRLLSSGPRTGINEINLPRRQPGSSIMPGKVNPVIPEVINQICFDVIGKDMTVTMAAEAGQLELNVMEPIIAHTLFLAVERLGIGCRTLGEKCVEGITANRERCLELVINSIGIVTNLVPVIGYEKSAAIAKEALETNKSVSEVALAHGVMTAEQLEKLLSPENMTRPNRAHL